MTRLATLATALLLVTAGCLGSTASPAADGGTDDPSTDDPTDTTSTTDRPDDRNTGERIFETTNCSETIEWVSFYALQSPGELGPWTPERAGVGYMLRGNASAFLIAYANGSRLGVEHVSTVGYDHGVTADGDKVNFDEPLTESRTIRVVAHSDIDRDETFDPETDLACTDDDGLISTGLATVDFGALAPATTANETGTGT
jgi:hypothetical protein